MNFYRISNPKQGSAILQCLRAYDVTSFHVPFAKISFSGNSWNKFKIKLSKVKRCWKIRTCAYQWVKNVPFLGNWACFVAFILGLSFDQQHLTKAIIKTTLSIIQNSSKWRHQIIIFFLFCRIVERGFYSEQDAAEVVRQLCQAIKVRETWYILKNDVSEADLGLLQHRRRSSVWE